MTKDPKAEIAELRRQIEYHNNLYYNNDAPEISDEEYDKLYARLKKLEEEYPLFLTDDSPTQHIGGRAGKQFSPVKHLTPMMSLDNTYSPEEVRAWHERTAKSLHKNNFEMVVEAKIDGMSLSLTFENGLLQCGATRGDGKVGEDITGNVFQFGRFSTDGYTKLIEIRGEAYMPKQELERINKERAAKGLNLFANTRNATAGSLRQKDVRISHDRNIKFFVHSFGGGENPGVKTFSEFIALCEEWGFATTPVRLQTTNIDEVIKFYEDFSEKRHALAFDTDGLVIKVNSFDEQEILGKTAKSPRWAIALKYAAEKAITTVEKIEFSVGRTGVITPTAALKPVPCAGVIISNATLHNFDEIKRLGLSEGDEVEIERAGEVIPKVVRVVKKHNHKEVEEPHNCPSCGAHTVRDEEEVALRCINPSCPAQVFGRIIHFAARTAMDIDGLGDAVAAQLLEKKYIKDFAGIYALTKEQLLTLELFKDKKADNLLAAIEKSKKKPLSKLLFAFGILHVGEKTAESIAKHFTNMDALIKAGEENIQRIAEVGPVVGKSIYEFFKTPQALEEIERLRKAGLNFEEPKTQNSSELEGKTFVFTGELTKMTREEAENMVKRHGGKASGSVSAKTSYVVAGAEAGSKLTKAQKLGVKILTEEEFIAIIKL